MTAYVDDMGLQATVQNGDQQVTGKWCHLFADTHEELMAVAEKAGLNPKWIQDAGTPDEHFDVTGKKIPAVVKAGAQPVSWRFTGQYFAERHDRARGAERAQERCDDIGCAERARSCPAETSAPRSAGTSPPPPTATRPRPTGPGILIARSAWSPMPAAWTPAGRGPGTSANGSSQRGPGSATPIPSQTSRPAGRPIPR